MRGNPGIVGNVQPHLGERAISTAVPLRDSRCRSGARCGVTHGGSLATLRPLQLIHESHVELMSRPSFGPAFGNAAAKPKSQRKSLRDVGLLFSDIKPHPIVGEDSRRLSPSSLVVKASRCRFRGVTRTGFASHCCDRQEAQVMSGGHVACKAVVAGI